MSDDHSYRGPHDRSRINLTDARELRYWMQAFRVSEQTLRDAVAEFGSSTDRVRQALGLQ